MQTSMLPRLAAASAVAAAVVAAAPAPGVAAEYHGPSYTECQHPVTTGVEVSSLRGISPAAACKVALQLYHYQHVIVSCGPSGDHPVLKLHSFDGFTNSLRPAFTMTRGRASFVVGGTDFPAAC